MASNRHEELTLRIYGGNLTLWRCQWEEMLGDMRPDSDNARRIAELLECGRPYLQGTCCHHSPHPREIAPGVGDDGSQPCPRCERGTVKRRTGDMWWQVQNLRCSWCRGTGRIRSGDNVVPLRKVKNG